MTPYTDYPDNAAFIGRDIFRRSRPFPRDNWPVYLMPGQTEWFGPTPIDYEDGRCLMNHRRDIDVVAQMAAKQGVFLHVKTVGEYIRTHRLRHGPCQKLSDWKQLPEGISMLVNPAATSCDFERALARSKYMKYAHLGLFRPWVDAKGGLWVERIKLTPK